MRFLGTSSADLLPEPLCKCWICEEARNKPEYQRLRSMFMLDPENLIDCGPDFGAALMKYKLDMTGLKNVFVTHTHADHFCASNAYAIAMSLTRNGMPVDIYLSSMGYRHIQKLIELAGDELAHTDAMKALKNGYVRLNQIPIGLPFFAGGYEVMAVNTTHQVSENETSINFRFKKDDVTLIYACDTGLYPEESIRYLAGSRADILIMEGTWGNRADKPLKQHLNAYAFLDQVEEFKKHDIIREDTRIYCTHINHKHSWNHEMYQQFFRENSRYDITVAMDGMEV